MSESCCTDGNNRIILSCAGAANTGQMTYQLALELTREGWGNLTCLAGIGAHLNSFVTKAMNAKEILVIDGCPLACARKNLEHAGISVRNHFIMTELGMKKEHGKAPAPKQRAQIKAAILNALRATKAPILPVVS